MTSRDGKGSENQGVSDPLKPLNASARPRRAVAAAIGRPENSTAVPKVLAAGRGKIAEKIVETAFANDIRVREDGPLAEMLVAVELDSPIPTEAFIAVAEVLYYVYKANGAPNPFDAVFGKGQDDPEPFETLSPLDGKQEP